MCTCDVASYHPSFDLGLTAVNDTWIGGASWEVNGDVTDTMLMTEPFWRDIGTVVYSHRVEGVGEGLMTALAVMMFLASIVGGCVLRGRARKKRD